MYIIINYALEDSMRKAKKARIRLSAEDKQFIIQEFTQNLIPMIDLAKQFGITRMGVWRILNVAGIDTTKIAARIPDKCTHCGKDIFVIRCNFRKTLNNFCSSVCYYAYLNRHNLENPLITRRHGMRLARAAVEKTGYILPPDSIVHHEDRNNNNNEISNLKVFSCQGDHVRHHRGFAVVPIWEGSNIKI
jgi:hypothetical protein